MKSVKHKTLDKTYRYAPIWKRTLAYIIDVCIYAPLAFLFTLSSRVYGYEGESQKSLFMILCLIIVSIMLFSYVPKKLNGQTVGKKLLGIRIQSTIDNKEISYWSYFLREYFAKIGIGLLIIPMSLLYLIFISIGNKKVTKAFMLDQLFSVRIVNAK